MQSLIQRPLVPANPAASVGQLAHPMPGLLAHPTPARLAQPAPGSAAPLPTPAPRPPHFDALRPAEVRGVETGTWFAGLSVALRQAILARCRVQRVRRGATLVRRGQAAADWVGVAGGALGLATSGRDGRPFTLDLLGPGDWYGDIALIDGSPVDLDVVAQVHSTVLLMDRHALQQLLHSQADLRGALLQLDCRRLRHMFRRLEEVQTLALSQRVALTLQRLLRQFGRPMAGAASAHTSAHASAHTPAHTPAHTLAPACASPGQPGHSGPAQQIELTLTQGDLASLLCASRQRINGTLRQMQALGILGASHGRIEVLLPQRLDDVAQGRLLLDSLGG